MHIRPASLALMFHAVVGSVVAQSAAAPSARAAWPRWKDIPEWQCRLIPTVRGKDESCHSLKLPESLFPFLFHWTHDLGAG